MRRALVVLVAMFALHCAHESLAPRVEELLSPAGAGAAEPFLFATADGALLSWLEPAGNRMALRFSRHRNGEWSAPRTIIEREDLFANWADFPSVVEDAKGTLFAHWLQKSGGDTYSYDVRMATSIDDGKTWTAPFLLNRDGKASEHGFVTLAPLPNGGVGATWLDGRNMTMGDDEEAAGDMTVRYATIDARGTIAVDTELDRRTCECCTTGMTMTSAGPLIVYRDRTPDEIRDIAYVRQTSSGWSAPRIIRADGWKMNGCPVNGPQADAIGNQVATAWFTAPNDRQRVYVAFSADGGATFGGAFVVDDGKPVGRADVVLLDENAAVVTWLEQTAKGAEIRARRVTAAGVASPSLKIADTAAARAAGFARIARVGNEVWFSWTEQSATNKKVHVAKTGF